MIYGLLFTLLSGISFLIGIFLLRHSKDKEKVSLFTISIAFVIMLGLVLFDILPELIETKEAFLIIPVIMGFLFLVVIDKMIPHHTHHHSEKNDNHIEHVKHLNHIGVITVIALSLHNMIEGLSLYNLTTTDIKAGLLMLISVGLHNIPLGFQLGNNLDFNRKNLSLIILLAISALLGAIIVILIGELTDVIINVILAITLGMLLYIIIFELFKEVFNSKKKKEVICGIMIGVGLLILMTLF